MRKVERAACPAPLVEKGDEWTAAWCRSMESDTGAQFRWPQYRNKPLNKVLEEPLGEMTQEHCAFCDGPFVESRRTVEHFRPKKKFANQAFEWGNLFPACDACQAAKLEKWNEFLLKPDDASYVFDEYFFCDADSGALIPNPAANDDNKARAKITIEIYGLNSPGRRTARLEQWKSFRARRALKEDVVLDDFNYRFFLDACLE